jgi:predicted unusual protein kinase regulating ubiquinone biosynthesis (AarF/ABC1/UbiB family)
MECDYVLEAANQKRFKELLKKRTIYITSVV